MPLSSVPRLEDPLSFCRSALSFQYLSPGQACLGPRYAVPAVHQFEKCPSTSIILSRSGKENYSSFNIHIHILPYLRRCSKNALFKEPDLFAIKCGNVFDGYSKKRFINDAVTSSVAISLLFIVIPICAPDVVVLG